MKQDTPHWYIAVVTPNTEKSCQKRIADWVARHTSDQPLDVETYVPSQRELHEWPSTGKRQWVNRIICPCLVFVRCTEAVRYRLKAECPFILHFMKDRATRKDHALVVPFAQIADSQMDTFRLMVGDADTPVMIDPSTLKVGSPVRIKTGRLKGLVGYLHRAPGKSTRFCIQIALLGYATMEIDAAMLEKV